MNIIHQDSAHFLFWVIYLFIWFKVFIHIYYYISSAMKMNFFLFVMVFKCTTALQCKSWRKKISEIVFFSSFLFYILLTRSKLFSFRYELFLHKKKSQCFFANEFYCILIQFSVFPTFQEMCLQFKHVLNLIKFFLYTIFIHDNIKWNVL